MFFCLESYKEKLFQNAPVSPIDKNDHNVLKYIIR